MFDDDFFGGGGRRRRGGGERNRGDGRGARGGGMLSLFEDDPFFSGGGGGFGGGMGGMMQRMDDMMRDMQQGGSMMGGDGNNGTFYSSSTVMSMSRGPDGKMQRYTSESQSTNAGGERISQTKQAYSNNAGLDKVGWERTIGDRGTKIVKQRTRGSHEETTTKMFTGMDPDNEQDFDNQWRQHGGRKALQNFGRRASNDMKSLMGGFQNESNRLRGRRQLGNDVYNGGRDRNDRQRIQNDEGRQRIRQTPNGRFLSDANNNRYNDYPPSSRSSRHNGY